MIPLFKPTIDTDAALAQLRQVFDSGWLGRGRKTDEFESKVAEYLGVRYFIGTNSCTSALHLAVKALDLPAKSLVLTTPITFVSTNAALLYEGLRPVFCDVEPCTGNISVASIERAIEEYGIQVRAIVVVHVGGYSCDMRAINKLNLPVIEDCAHAFGATYRGERVGKTGNLCCWSFHAVKNLPMGDGGGVSTNDPKIAARLRRLRWLGITTDTASRVSGPNYTWDYDIPELGFKYHMNDVQAAIGLAMLPRVAEQNARRKVIAERYLAEIRTAGRPCYNGTRESSYHFLPLFFEQRDHVARQLQAAGIHVGMHYKRNDLYKPFLGFPKVVLTGARWYAERELTLPLHPSLSDEQVRYIIEQVNRCV